MGFVGRVPALADLADALRLARSGEPQVVIVGGEAGAGKTRLLEHFSAQAEGSGARVLRVACLELGTEGLPLAPLTAVLRSLVDTEGLDALRRLAGIDPLLRLLPELGNGRDDGPRSQAQLLDLFGTLIWQLGGSQPLLLIIDDLQWADASTRELFGMLARARRSSQVLLATAYRTEDVGRAHPLRSFLAELERLRAVRRIEVGPFSRAETAELMADLLGSPAPDATLDRVHRRSGGNPFFAEELTGAPATDAVPELLRDLLIHQIERLRVPASHVVQVAAVGGLRVSHELLAAAADIGERELLAALRVAADARILLPDSAGYAFRHRLLRDAVLDDLLPAERLRLHRTYAEALEAEPNLVPRDRLAAELAFHWYGAGVESKAAPALLQAAEAAQSLYAHAEQFRLLERAFELWSPATGIDRLALLEKATEAATWGGEDIAALDLVDRVLAEIDPANDPERAALALAHRGMLLQGQGREGAQTAVEEALGLLPPERSLGRARVLDLAGAVLALRGLAGHARELTEEAAELAAEHRATDLEANARITLGWALSQLGHYDRALVTLQAAQALADKDPLQRVRVQLNLANRARRIGDHDAAIDAAQHGLAQADAAGVNRTLGPRLATELAAALFATGRWDEADAICQWAIDVDPPGTFGATLHAQRAEIALARGAVDRTAGELASARTLLGPPAAATHPFLARVDAELALVDNRARQAADLMMAALPVEVTSRAAPVDLWPLAATAARVIATLRVGTGASTNALHAALRDVLARLPTDTAVDRAYADQVAAELAESTTSWSRVADAWNQLGCAYHSASAKLRAAEEILRNGDLAATQDLLIRSHKTAIRLGATTLAADVRRLARSVRITLDASPGTAAPTREADRLGLTDREAEILRLVADGRSNRQIGEELFISPKTVSVHVSNILSKLNAASRGEAAAIAHRLRLFDDQPT